MYWLPVFILIVIVAYWLKDAMKNVKVPSNIGKDKNSMLCALKIVFVLNCSTICLPQKVKSHFFYLN